MNMKLLLGMMIILAIILVGCKAKTVESTSVAAPETEIAGDINDLDDIQAMDQDLNDGVNLDELEVVE
ncbi:hypothetical protein HYX14_04140 [Candidatus Woesearchaeota archaeon]|nr:hypothetical protein [Candidatus Woesearchaeota archaeon]